MLSTPCVDDPRKCVSFREGGIIGLDGAWMRRAQDYFYQVADDGYVIATGTEVPEEEVLEVRRACATGGWYICSATDCLGECASTGCNCNRSRNPTARDGFLRTVVHRMVEVAAGRTEVSYASVGSGFLRFDFALIEALLAAGVPVTAVHLVDTQYAPDAKGHDAYRVSVAQFASWFQDRGVDVYAHSDLERFSFLARQAALLPVAVIQVDCSELTAVFDTKVKPVLEEVLHYGGLFCALTAREGASGVGSAGSMDAWGEVWRLSPESGRLKLVSRLRYRPGVAAEEVGEDEPLPPIATH